MIETTLECLRTVFERASHALRASSRAYSYRLFGRRRIRGLFPQMTSAQFKTVAEVVSLVDRSIDGRYAGTVFDKWAHCSASLCAAKGFPDAPQYAHVEIGVLFGGSLISRLLLINSSRANQTHIAIDPLHTYYGKGVDPVTGLHLSKEMVLRNLERLRLSPQNVVFCETFSDDSKTIETVARYKIISLFIDGDHTVEGVKKDWEAYGPHVVKGAYVVFDNYASRGWPGVKSFVDQLLPSLSSQEWKKIGVYYDAFLLQRL